MRKNMVKKTEEKKNGNYHVVITDNKTDEVLFDENTNVILGGVSTDDGNCEVICVKGSLVDIAAATIAAKQSVENCIKKNPEINLLASILKADLAEAEEVKK